MDTATVTLIVGIGSIFASGVVSSFVTYRLNRNHTQKIFLREKAEQLYLSTDEFGKDLSCHVISYYPLIRGEIDYNKMLEMQIENSSVKKYGGHETMTMLVDIYFPSVKPALENVLKAQKAYSGMASSIRSAYQSNGHLRHEDWNSKVTKVAIGINDSINELQHEIVVAARTHAGVKHKHAHPFKHLFSRRKVTNPSNR
ncbi:MAG: hypothetical protein ACTHLA_06475 [Asticcacaulis sp.]|uniref:hypothetical protein n=1 Tax=Asticcacaulis sp. TaxID=1872648 RepID=UPI003F7C2955